MKIQTMRNLSRRILMTRNLTINQSKRKKRNKKRLSTIQTTKSQLTLKMVVKKTPPINKIRL